MPIISYENELDDEKYDDNPMAKSIKSLFQLINVIGLDESNIVKSSMVGGAWLSWTPTLTNLSGGAITLAKYSQVGKTVCFIFKYTLGSAVVSGNVSFTLPVTAHADFAAQTTFGSVRLTSAGVGHNLGMLEIKSSADAYILVMNGSGTNVYNQALSSTVPFTWKNTDLIIVTGFYEAA